MSQDQASIYEAWIQRYLPLVGGDRSRAETAADAARQAFGRGEDETAADQAGLRTLGLAKPSTWRRPPAAFWFGLGASVVVNLAWWGLLDHATCAAGDALANPVVSAFVQTCPTPPPVTVPKGTAGGGPGYPWVPVVLNVAAPLALAFTRFRAAAVGVLAGWALAFALFIVIFIVLAASGF